MSDDPTPHRRPDAEPPEHPAAPEQTRSGFDEGARTTPRDDEIGRFDEGEREEEEPEQRHVGRFDEGEAEHPDEHEGRFDEGEREDD